MMTNYQTVTADTLHTRSDTIKLHGPEGFAGMRKAGGLVAQCLDGLTTLVKPGVTTAQIDDFVREFAFAHHAIPATLMYRGYRYSTCTSINHVICHGIPGPKALREGDIANIDVTLLKGDLSSGPDLPDLMAQALEQNNDIRAGIHRIEQARANFSGVTTGTGP